ncbi:MAG TPA: SpoIVB peptidase S55 domain-containing protein [Gemmataceae bacterium]|nr:SpoIVB peptidase S55 domain-containing protein [Gemmataceae bacterium]
MTVYRRPTPLLVSVALFAGLLFLLSTLPSAQAGPKPEAYWQVDDIRAGMKGHGRTVLKGTKVETFQAEVLGVLKNTSPGRDLVLCRLSGLGLEKTGVIAGMSGSPIYIDGKLLGAVAYAWAFGKEPIAGVTPFSQMHGYVESYERRDLANQAGPTRVGLARPLTVGGQTFDTVTVAQSYDDPPPASDEGLWMAPLKTPLAATGFTPHSLGLLRDRLRGTGLVPVQGGAVSAKVMGDEKNTPLEPGGPLAVALVLGDFDLSGIGTVTHIEGSRVYGWGHPFLGLGTCEYPLMTGYIHTIYPRQSISFKMGSPLRTVGIINADVSTGIAGWLERKPDLLPIRMTITREPEGVAKTFNVQVVRQRSLLASLVYSVLTNSVDMEGELPDELTAELEARIEIEGHEPVVIQDTFSGSSYSGGKAPQALYQQIASLVSLLTYNSHTPVRLGRIECHTRILPGRRTADIEAIELDSDVYSPGETLKAMLYVRPYKGLRQRLPLTLKLPADLPEGTYTAIVCDDLTNARYELRDNPQLSSPQNLDQVLEAIKVQTQAKRTNVVLRVPVSAAGVALGGKPLPNLPPSMVQILGNSRKTGAQTMGGALVSRQSTDWVFQGSDSVRFTVTKNKKITNPWDLEAPRREEKSEEQP